MRITRRALDKLGPEDGSPRGRRYLDDDLHGFFATVYSTGRISFAVRYRVHGQRRMVQIGTYPATMPEAARKEALAIIGGAARGEDEAAKRVAARGAIAENRQRLTFKAWRATYTQDVTSKFKAPYEPTRYLALAGEAWDAKALSDISTADVDALRTQIAKRGQVTANRFCAHVAAAFKHAVRLGHIEKNPFANVRAFPETPRQRVLTADEEARLREVLMTWPNPLDRVAFTLLLDTGARLSEVLHARWADFDLDPVTHVGLWRLPKTKSGRPQVVPILADVGAVVAATPRLDENPYLVPGRTARPRTSLRSWAALKVAAKLPADVHIHDLRRSYGLRVTRGPAGIFGASKLLRHGDVRVTQRTYAPLDAKDLHAFASATETARQGKLKP